jgi:NAD(P)H-dependent flavin oxidoreductase YrpB (nitropropane dioxygenase family)
LAAVLVAGADGGRVGTRFAAAGESLAHPQWKQRLLAAGAADTVLTDRFRVGWDMPHRVLRSAVEAAERFEGDVVGEEHFGAQTVPLPRFSMIPPSEHATGEIDAMALYGSSAAAAITRVEPAAAILGALVDEADAALDGVAALR